MYVCIRILRQIVIRVSTGVFRNLSNIFDGTFWKDNQPLKSVYQFREKLDYKYLAGSKMGL